MNDLFKAWPKIPRGKGQQVTISEKLDGTNSCVIIKEGEIVGVQSRNRMITVDDDNYGFAKWVSENKEKLEQLGDGYHYGEWYGAGIQKNPHNKDGKYFALFNTFRYGEHNPLPEGLNIEIVPVVFRGAQEDIIIEEQMGMLEENAKVEGYNPEGLIIYYHNTRTFEKYTFKNVDGKWSNK